MIWHLCHSLYFWTDTLEDGTSHVEHGVRNWERDLSYFIYTSSIILQLIVFEIYFNTIFKNRMKNTRFEFYTVLSFSFLFASSYLKIPILFSRFLVLFYSSSPCFMIYSDVLFQLTLPSKLVTFSGIMKIDPTESSRNVM